MKKSSLPIRWSCAFAYGVGLMASDGNIHKDGRHIHFCSQDSSLIENFKKAFNAKGSPYVYPEKGNRREYYIARMSDKRLWNYLYSIGIHPAKSKTIGKIKIPDRYFLDFIRGCFDGDGSFYTFWDKRWPKSFGYITTLASASKKFLQWIKKALGKKIGTKGFIKRGKGIYELRYTKTDTKLLHNAMYRKAKGLCLERKRVKIEDAIRQGEALKPR